MYLLVAIWADKKFGWYAIFSNLVAFSFIYYRTLYAGINATSAGWLGEPLYPFVVNCLITIFFGGFLAYQQYDQERDRAKIRALQDQKISTLDEAVKKRTEQLNSMRETIANDFHDQTGNMLSAITRQASLLKIKLKAEHEVQPIVKSIIDNSNELYASSKDFLWHLNHNSDDPTELFDYLTGYGQLYFNQFDIAFSAKAELGSLLQFESYAALNLIYIFKEAMTNVVRHAAATEVKLAMQPGKKSVTYLLEDNGSWKEADNNQQHYGLSYMERRCQKNNFKFALQKSPSGTRIEIIVPAHQLNAT
jgi:signal transduction histidine kinase